MTARIWSPLQQAVFDDVKHGAGNTVVIARAGSGKSTTLEECVRLVPDDQCVLVLAFNRAIADAFKTRVHGLPNVDVMTAHSFGLRACGQLGKLKIDGQRSQKLARPIADAWGKKHAFDARRAMCRVVSFAKGALINVNNFNALENIVDERGVDVPEGRSLDAFLTACSRLLDRCADVSDGALDFDDMIWLPIVRGLRITKYARVFVDETQDLNAAQLELSIRALAPSGRALYVGDDRQAIYGFRGADENAVSRVVERLEAKVLPLSITYRCARSIVEVARREVPDLEAAPNAIDGIVRRVKIDDLDPEPGDAVLSRTNAPLISLCLQWLGRGVRCAILGRDVGESLRALVAKLDASSVPQLRDYVAQWRDVEVQRLTSKDPPLESAAQAVEDRAECLFAISNGCSSIEAVVSRLEQLFDGNDDSSAHVTLSSTHKAKGLEWDRVWVLRDTYRAAPGAPQWKRKGTVVPFGAEERNLWYVCTTRAKTELMIVEGTP